MIDLHYPPTTFVGKPVPKNAFYRHLEVNAKMKQHFVDDVVAIKWLYKLAPSTLNVADGKEVHEIVVFSAQLKSRMMSSSSSIGTCLATWCLFWNMRGSISCCSTIRNGWMPRQEPSG